MNYKSTREINPNNVKSSTFGALHGLCEDGGLYIP